MNAEPMFLPWTLENVPHAVLDINRGCNIRCRDCFNTQPPRTKSLDEIDAELDTLQRLRNLQSITMVGGEITLHPDLLEIVRRVKKRGLCVELFTNGLDLNAELLKKLKAAGTSLIFLHIEAEQHRPDLPPNASRADLGRLRAEKAALIRSHGMDAGLVVTVYPDKLEEAAEAVDFTLQSPDLTYLLVTLWRNVKDMPPLRGDLDSGIYAVNGGRPADRGDSLTIGEVCQPIEERFHLFPFASVGSILNLRERRWLSYLVASVYHEDSLACLQSLKPTLVERAFLKMNHLVTGRHMFYQSQSTPRLLLQLLFNSLFGGGLRTLRALTHGLRPGARMMLKRILFQCAASLDAQGRLVHCHCCPDAVVRNGKLVPLCISDLVVPESSPLHQPAKVA